MNGQCDNRDTIHIQRCAQLMLMLVKYGPLPTCADLGGLEIQRGICVNVEFRLNRFLQENKGMLGQSGSDVRRLLQHLGSMCQLARCYSFAKTVPQCQCQFGEDSFVHHVWFLRYTGPCLHTFLLFRLFEKLGTIHWCCLGSRNRR